MGSPTVINAEVRGYMGRNVDSGYYYFYNDDGPIALYPISLTIIYNIEEIQK